MAYIESKPYWPDKPKADTHLWMGNASWKGHFYRELVAAAQEGRPGHLPGSTHVFHEHKRGLGCHKGCTLLEVRG